MFDLDGFFVGRQCRDTSHPQWSKLFTGTHYPHTIRSCFCEPKRFTDPSISFMDPVSERLLSSVRTTVAQKLTSGRGDGAGVVGAVPSDHCMQGVWCGLAVKYMSN
jgi:hypothetical protein